MDWKGLKENSKIRQFRKKTKNPLRLIKQGKALLPDRTLKEYARRKQLNIPIPTYIENAVKISLRVKTGKNLERYKKSRKRLMVKREREHRRKPTPAEKKLYAALKSIYPGTRLQKGIMCEGGRFYILDIFLPDWNMAVEVDGSSHGTRRDYDKMRDGILAAKGIMTLRFANTTVFDNIDHVLDSIKSEVSIRRRGISFSISNSPHKAELQAPG